VKLCYSDNVPEIAEAVGASEELRQVGMRQGFVPVLEATHSLGPNPIGQADQPLGGVVR
jgi:hypothetical protein